MHLSCLLPRLPFLGRRAGVGEVHFAGWLALNSIYFLNIYTFRGFTVARLPLRAAPAMIGVFFFGLEVTRNRANIDDLAIEWLPGCWHMYLTHRPTDQPTNRPTDWLCDWQGIFISQLLKQRHLSWSPLLVFLFAFACFNKRLPSGFHLQAKFSISPWLRQGIFFFVFGRDLGPCTLINRRV